MFVIKYYLLRKLLSAQSWTKSKSLYFSTENKIPLAKSYRPKDVEQKWLNKLDKKQCKTDSKKKPYRIILPPPNITGNLHLGHALNAVIQDVLCRHHSYLGHEIIWVPGTDHAGIATQVVIEKKLLKEKGFHRKTLGREVFLSEILKWKDEKRLGIIKDLKQLGCSLNWEREYFTMDVQQNKAVEAAFIKLFEKGLITRKNALVNWSCALESSISDIEIDTLDIKKPTDVDVPGYKEPVKFGQLYFISYPVCNMNEEIIVSTTRPETILGDVAVAVHPEDERYIKYRYEKEVKLKHPFRDEVIPLIFDVSVDQNFATGAVKITPAHDKADFEIAERHLLKPVQVFNEQGRVLSKFQMFQNMLRFEAREKILSELEEMKLLIAVKDHAMSLPVCSRSKDIIEYMIRPQWFLQCQPMADAAISEVRSGCLQIVPANFETDWFRWLTDCRDWCISRQLWWGHQIPAYFAKSNEGQTCCVAAASIEEALEKAKLLLKSDDLEIERDSDVLDTWFSSSLLPFSSFGWPSSIYKQNYPLDLMQTGHDILFFWTARMVMLGLELTEKAPFKKILLNGLLCDAFGRKMSKSIGNVTTPKQVIEGASLQNLQEEIQHNYDLGLLSDNEKCKSMQGVIKMFPKGIKECGADALRFTLCSYNIKNHFINFNATECNINKLFFNKIWQATRFTLGAADKLKMPLHEIETMNHVQLGKWDRWILSRLSDTIQVCATSIDNYNFHTATAALKQFFYNNFCDVYLETTKANINAGNKKAYVHCATLATCLSWGLQAMLPFTPFFSNELLQHLPRNIRTNMLALSHQNLEKEILEILSICQNIRQVKSVNQISKKHEPIVHLFPHTKTMHDLLLSHLEEIRALTMATNVILECPSNPDQKSKEYHIFSTAGPECSFGITGDINYEEIQKLIDMNKRKLVKLEVTLEQYRVRLKDEGFLQSASEDIQKKHIEKMHRLEKEIDNIKSMR